MSEEDKGGNESDSDEDGQLDDNSETNKKGGTCTDLNWTNTLNFKEIRKHKNLLVLYQLAAVRKIILSYL
jgi:hypothetical protein